MPDLSFTDDQYIMAFLMVAPAIMAAIVLVAVTVLSKTPMKVFVLVGLAIVIATPFAIVASPIPVAGADMTFAIVWDMIQFDWRYQVAVARVRLPSMGLLALATVIALPIAIYRTVRATWPPKPVAVDYDYVDYLGEKYR